jgi:hypothetical protein
VKSRSCTWLGGLLLVLTAPLAVIALVLGGLGILGFASDIHETAGAYCTRLSPLPSPALPPDANPVHSSIELFPLGVSCVFKSNNGAEKVVVSPPWTNTIELLAAAVAAFLAIVSMVMGVVVLHAHARQKVRPCG